MFSICKGSLTMSSNDLDCIQKRINEGNTPKMALTNELECRGLNIKNVYDIELTGYLMKQTQYLKLYSEIVTDCWNKK